jgi:Predicted hydrolases or acyltransferases (alpha/beta hydrolase superfamily)
MTTPTHATARVPGGDLHYVTAGESGSPVLLVHGYPESWWAFHRVIPLLARTHRVVAVDLLGFGDSSLAPDGYDSAAAAADLHALVGALGLGPVHLVAQDISGGAAFRFAAGHPGDVLSFIAAELGLAGFGLEAFADVTHGGSWHIGALVAPGIPELLFAGRERELLAGTFQALTADPASVTADDVAEFARGYARPGGWRGATALYRSMLAEGEELRALAASAPLRMPTLAIGGFAGPFTANTVAAVSATPPRSVQLDGVGHHVALEAPEAFAQAVAHFLAEVDAG